MLDSVSSAKLLRSAPLTDVRIASQMSWVVSRTEGSLNGLRVAGNETKEMDYLSSLISKWMPEHSKRVAVDSHPRLSGIMDTINATLAHGPDTRLPSKFYDPKGREIIDKIGVEEWFSGYSESNEYRKVGIGALVGDIVSHMVGSIEQKGNDGMLEIGGEEGSSGSGRGGEKFIKFAMSGCHDTTLASVLCSLGAFDGENWPPYTSHIAIELFKENTDGQNEPYEEDIFNKRSQVSRRGLFGSAKRNESVPEGIERKPMIEFTPSQKEKLKGHYVRVLYNDRTMTIPGCRLPGKHLEGDESFCTLVSTAYMMVLGLLCIC